MANSGHDSSSANEHGTPFVSEKSPHDIFLTAMAAVVLVGLLSLGIYWQSLPLPVVQAEEETSKK